MQDWTICLPKKRPDFEWHSKYSGDLKSGLVGILNGQREVGLQMVWILNRIWNPEARPFRIWTSGRHFVKNHLKSGQKCLHFEWSGFQMVGTIAVAIAKARPFENRTIWNPTFEKTGFQMFLDFEWLDFRSSLYLMVDHLKSNLKKVGFWRVVFRFPNLICFSF